jgi:hypothetical protein
VPLQHGGQFGCKLGEGRGQRLPFKTAYEQ